MKATQTISLDRGTRGGRYTLRAVVAQPRFGAQDEQVSLRLAELGFLPGCEIKVIGTGLFGGDPLAVQINGSKFALRRTEAAKLRVVPTESTHSTEPAA